MKTKSKNRGGNYICKVGYFDIRQQVTILRKVKTLKVRQLTQKVL